PHRGPVRGLRWLVGAARPSRLPLRGDQGRRAPLGLLRPRPPALVPAGVPGVSPDLSYVPLWCKSNFSFLEGASHPQELVETAAELGISALALTDRDGVYGMVEAHVEARQRGVKLI